MEDIQYARRQDTLSWDYDGKRVLEQDLNEYKLCILGSMFLCNYWIKASEKYWSKVRLWIDIDHGLTLKEYKRLIRPSLARQ